MQNNRNSIFRGGKWNNENLGIHFRQFVVITPKSPLTCSHSTCFSPINGSNRAEKKKTRLPV